MASWKKVIVSGSIAELNIVSASGGFFGDGSALTGIVGTSEFTSHITASGNIRVSGNVIADDAAFDGTVIAGLGGTSKDGFKIGGDAGNIGYITNINGLRLQATSQDPTNAATPHITVGIGGHITASGDISASGDLMVNNINGTINGGTF